MSDTILVSGVIDLDPAKRDGAIEAAEAVMAATRAEDGCITYTFSADLSDPGRFWLFEQWRDQAALDAHLAQPHLAEFTGRMGEFGVTATDITIWSGAEPRQM